MSREAREEPAVSDLWSELAEIWKERGDLQEAFPDPGSPDLEFWAGSHGLLESPGRLGRFFPPVPEHDLRRTGCGGESAQNYLWTGSQDFRVLMELWTLFGDGPHAETPEVFDFGCASGRVLRWFAHALPRARLSGCDVRAAGPDWCSEHLGGEFFANETRPPLPFESDRADLVYALSVFSHLEPASANAWMRELVRVCRRGGRLCVTVCGAFTLWAILHSNEQQRSFGISRELAREYLRRLPEEGAVFHPLAQDVRAPLEGVGTDYGHVFVTEEWVRREWGAMARVLAYVPASLSLLQDFVVLGVPE